MPTDGQRILRLACYWRPLMPTDEQRKQFEAWGRTYYLNLIRTRGGRYRDVLTEAAYAAWRARDAEVQELREELLNYVSADEMAVGEGYGTYPKSEHRRIRALVAGEEGSDND